MVSMENNLGEVQYGLWMVHIIHILLACLLRLAVSVLTVVVKNHVFAEYQLRFADVLTHDHILRLFQAFILTFYFENKTSETLE